MTHHAAALTYYALMSLFPTVLLGLSLARKISHGAPGWTRVTKVRANNMPKMRALLLLGRRH